MQMLSQAKSSSVTYVLKKLCKNLLKIKPFTLPPPLPLSSIIWNVLSVLLLFIQNDQDLATHCQILCRHTSSKGYIDKKKDWGRDVTELLGAAESVNHLRWAVVVRRLMDYDQEVMGLTSASVFFSWKPSVLI